MIDCMPPPYNRLIGIIGPVVTLIFDLWLLTLKTFSAMPTHVLWIFVLSFIYIPPLSTETSHYHGYPQAWARGGTCPLPPSGKSVLCTAKRSVDELFMHYFHNLSSALPPNPYRGSIPGPPLGDFSPQPPNLPIPGKNPADTHAHYYKL